MNDTVITGKYVFKDLKNGALYMLDSCFLKKAQKAESSYLVYACLINPFFNFNSINDWEYEQVVMPLLNF